MVEGVNAEGLEVCATLGMIDGDQAKACYRRVAQPI